MQIGGFLGEPLRRGCWHDMEHLSNIESLVDVVDGKNSIQIVVLRMPRRRSSVLESERNYPLMGRLALSQILLAVKGPDDLVLSIRVQALVLFPGHSTGTGVWRPKLTRPRDRPGNFRLA